MLCYTLLGMLYATLCYGLLRYATPGYASYAVQCYAMLRYVIPYTT